MGGTPASVARRPSLPPAADAANGAVERPATHEEMLRAYDQDLFWDRHDKAWLIASDIPRDDPCHRAELLALRCKELAYMRGFKDRLNPDTPTQLWEKRRLESSAYRERINRTLAVFQYMEGVVRQTTRVLRGGALTAEQSAKMVVEMDLARYRLRYAQARQTAVRDKLFTIGQIERSEGTRMAASWWASAAQKSLSVAAIARLRAAKSYAELRKPDKAKPPNSSSSANKRKQQQQPGLAALAKQLKTVAASQGRVLSKLGSLRNPRAKPKPQPNPNPPNTRKPKRAAAATATAAPPRKKPAHGGCPHCKKQGFEGWEWHPATKCFELVPAIRPDGYVMRKDR